MLRIDSVSYSYDVDKILYDISFNIEEKDFVGILGPNGAGKTTLFKLISGILKTQNGAIYFKNQNIREINSLELARKIAFMPQLMDIYFNYTVNDFVLMGRFPYLKRFENLKLKDIEIVEKSLILTETLELSKRYLNELSAGEKQRVFLAQALAQEPKIILLDEPTAHLDIGHQESILNVIRKLNRELGLTIVAVMHDLNLASEYCNSLVLINKGRIIESGDVEKVLTYNNIKNVFGANVYIENNKYSKKPNVFVVSK